jgi:tRNA(fMet)-specific endonuclease VapC
MSGNIALDTSVAVALLRGDQRVAQFVARSSVFISTIAVGELCFGAEKSHRPSIGYRHIE